MNKPIIPLQKSVVVACDVVPALLPALVEATADVHGIGGYKVGFRLMVIDGLPRVVKAIKNITDKPVIFDGQKFGNDIPELGPKFASDLAICGVDAVIIFPFTGPVTQRVWTEACLKEGLTVIVGGEMTHKGFLATDTPDSGYIRVDAPSDIYGLAVEMGIRDFVVPGNKPEKVQHYRENIGRWCEITDEKEFRFYAPGLIKQGGIITETGKVAGKYWHAIVGSAIYDKIYGENKMDAMRAAAEETVSQINAPVQAAA